ncbi:MAG TPA: hypothetical protein VF846_01345 [Thermoanaerobaculia bacterium]
MRLMLLLLSLVVAAPAYACCITVTPRGVWFFDKSVAVGYARWTVSGAFIVEKVVRGDLRTGQTIRHESWPCANPTAGELYLISRNCHAGDCRIGWASGDDATNMQRYLDRAHVETHGAILEKAIAWASGELPFAEFRDWIDTVAVDAPSDGDHAFAISLVADLSDLLSELAVLPEEARAELDLSELVKLAKAFPAGAAEEFDDQVDAAQEAAHGEIELPYRRDYEDELLATIEKAEDVLRQRFPSRP